MRYPEGTRVRVLGYRKEARDCYLPIGSEHVVNSVGFITDDWEAHDGDNTPDWVVHILKDVSATRETSAEPAPKFKVGETARVVADHVPWFPVGHEFTVTGVLQNGDRVCGLDYDGDSTSLSARFLELVPWPEPLAEPAPEATKLQQIAEMLELLSGRELMTVADAFGTTGRVVIYAAEVLAK